MIDIKHGRKIITDSYYNGEIASSKEEIEISVFSTKDHILRDVIDSMVVITSGESTKLELEVCIDKLGRYRLIKRWRL